MIKKIINKIKPFLLLKNFRFLNMKTWKFIFVFHFNQYLTPYGSIVVKKFYQPFLEFLHNQNIPLVLHICGPVILLFKEYAPSCIEIINSGIKNKKFKLLFSTVSQNIPYSSHPEDVKIAINFHKELIKEYFNTEPIGFWLSERVVSSEILDIISNYGATYTFVEDFILNKVEKSKFKEQLFKFKVPSGNDIFIFTDDNELRWEINAIVNGINSPSFLNFKNYLNKFSEISRPVFVYAEDAEVAGVWELERTGKDLLKKNLNRFKAIFEFINKASGKIVHPEHIINSNPVSSYLEEIKEGCANWMDVSCKDNKQVFKELSYKNWFDFNKNSKKLNKFRKIFTAIRNELKKYNADQKDSKLLKLAYFNFIMHQFEFGCIGVGSENSALWSLAQNSLLYCKLICHKNKQKGDFNNDGIEELVLYNEKYSVIISLKGARLLKLFYKPAKDLFCGMDLVNYYTEPFNGDIIRKNLYFKSPLFQWLPENSPIIFHKKFDIRKNGFNDFIIEKDKITNLYLKQFSLKNYSKTQALFEYKDSNFTITKKFILDNCLKIKYELAFPQQDINFEIFSGFTPNMFEYIFNKNSKLKFTSENNTSLFFYSISHSKLAVNISPAPESTIIDSGVFEQGFHAKFNNPSIINITLEVIQ